MNVNFRKGSMELFRAGAMALAVAAAAWMQPAAATTIMIDDLTDTLTASINGIPITFPGQVVGTFPNEQDVTGFLIQSGSPSHPETAAINFTDFSLPPVGPPRVDYLFGHVLLTSPDGTISDSILVGYDYDNSTGSTISHLQIQMDSDFDSVPLSGCGPGNNCITLPETGGFQDITAAAFATMSLAFGPPGIISAPEGFTILVRSDVTDETVPVPEPASLTLLGLGLAAMSGIRRRNSLLSKTR